MCFKYGCDFGARRTGSPLNTFCAQTFEETKFRGGSDLLWVNNAFLLLKHFEKKWLGKDYFLKKKREKEKKTMWNAVKTSKTSRIFWSKPPKTTPSKTHKNEKNVKTKRDSSFLFFFSKSAFFCGHAQFFSSIFTFSKGFFFVAWNL